MAKFTPKYNLELPAYNEFYNVDIENTNFEKVDEALDVIDSDVDAMISDMVKYELETVNNIFGTTYKSLSDANKARLNEKSILSLENKITGEDNIIKDIESFIKGKLTTKELIIEDHQYDVKVTELETRCDELYKLLYEFTSKCERLIKRLNYKPDDTDLSLIDYINSLISVISGGLDVPITGLSLDKSVNGIVTKLGNAINKNGTIISGTIQDSYNRYETNNESYFRNLVMVNGITSTKTDTYSGICTTKFDNNYEVSAVFANDSNDDIYDPLVDDDFYDRTTLIVTSSLPYTFGNKIINGKMKFSIKLDKKSINNLFKPVTSESDEDYGMSIGYLIVRYVLNGYSDYSYDRYNRDTLALCIVSELPEYRDEYCVLCRIKISANLTKGNNEIACDMKNVETYYNTDFAAKNITNKIYKEYEYYMITNPDETTSGDYIANLYEARTNGTKNDGSDSTITDPIDEAYKYRDEVYELDYDNTTKYQVSDIYDKLLESKTISVGGNIYPKINNGFFGNFKSMPYLMYLKPGKINKDDDIDERDIYFNRPNEIFYSLYAVGDLKNVVIKSEEVDGETVNTTYFDQFKNRIKELGFHIRGVDGKSGYKFYQERIDYFSGDDYIGDDKLANGYNEQTIKAKCGNEEIGFYSSTYSDNVTDYKKSGAFVTYPFPICYSYAGEWYPDTPNQGFHGMSLDSSYIKSGVIERFICTGSSGNHYSDDIYKDTDYYNISECYDLIMVQNTLLCASDLLNANKVYKRWFCVNMLTGEIVDKYGHPIYTIRLNETDEDIKDKRKMFSRNCIDIEVALTKDELGNDKILKIINWKDASRWGYMYHSTDLGVIGYTEKEFIDEYEDVILNRITKTLAYNKGKSTVNDIMPINCRCESSQWKRFCPYKLEWNDCHMMLPKYSIGYDEIYKWEERIGDEIQL